MNKRDALLLAIPISLVFIVMFSVGVNAGNIPNFYNDTTPPVITILGDNPASVQIGTNYTDAGATAWDSYDGILNYKISSTNFVDASTIGTYHVVYAVTDFHGNTATVNRTVNVVAQLTKTANTNTNATSNETQATLANTANPFSTGTNITATPITGGVVEALTSTGGIVGIVAFAFVLIMAIIILRTRRKFKKMQESISTTLAEGNKKI